MDARTAMTMLTGAFLLCGTLVWWSWAGRQAARREALAHAQLAQQSITALLENEGVCGARASAEHLVRVMLGIVERDGVSVALLVDGDLSFAGEAGDAHEVVRGLLVRAFAQARSVSSYVQIVIADQRLDIAVPRARSLALDAADVREPAGRVGWRVRREWTTKALRYIVEPAFNA